MIRNTLKQNKKAEFGLSNLAKGILAFAILIVLILAYMTMSGSIENLASFGFGSFPFG